MAILVCHKCGHENSFTDLVGRRDDCAKCHSDLHACKNCAHYDAKSYNECKETQADVVKDKEKSNFCDYYSPRVGGVGSGGKTANDLKAAAEALFKKK
jgi:hypothetical protein